MDDPLVLVGWNDFHAAVAGVAATLVGLLFVALALNPAVMADDGPTGLRTWAGQTFHSFLMVLVFALIVLIPETSPLGLGLPVLILGIWGVARVIDGVRRVRGDPTPEWHGRPLLTRCRVLLAGFVGGSASPAQRRRGGRLVGRHGLTADDERHGQLLGPAARDRGPPRC